MTAAHNSTRADRNRRVAGAFLLVGSRRLRVNTEWNLMSAAASDVGGSGEAPVERFDELIARLRNLVDKLESGNLPLEEGLRYFEEGMALCRKGAAILDGAEKRVELLLTNPGGDVRPVPFEATGAPGRDEAG